MSSVRFLDKTHESTVRSGTEKVFIKWAKQSYLQVINRMKYKD